MIRKFICLDLKFFHIDDEHDVNIKLNIEFNLLNIDDKIIFFLLNDAKIEKKKFSKMSLVAMKTRYLIFQKSNRDELFVNEYKK